MDKLLRDMPLFVEVARQKSFTRAADVLDIPLSTVSRRILALEKELGMPLFYRSARKVEPTEIGKAFFERCNFIVSEAQIAREELANNMRSPRGRVRVSLPSDVYHSYLSGFFGRFAAQWPGIQLHAHLSERWVDLLSEPYDLDMRVGALPDSRLRARKLFILRPALYASPKLLEFYPMPRKPEDISAMPCITMFQQGEVWTMNKGETQATVNIHSPHMSNSVSLTLEFALAGLGVVWLMPAQAAGHEARGELVRLLPEWRHFDVDLHIVMADTQLPQRVRIFVDHLVEYFAGLPQ